MIRHKLVRTVVWLATVILIGIVLYPFLLPHFILYRVLHDPLLQEFKRCELLSFGFYLEQLNSFTVKDLYFRKYLGIDLSYKDTLSKYGIQYRYTVNVKLDDCKVACILFGGFIELSDSCSVAGIIGRIESDSAFGELLENSDINDCYYDWPYFIYTGHGDVIKYSLKHGIVYFSLVKPPEYLRFSPYYTNFLEMIKEKGFIFADFDSIHYIGVGSYKQMEKNVWRLQGFCTDFKEDCVEVGNCGLGYVHLRWLSIPDSIDPTFLNALILNELYTAGLSENYVEKKLILQETGTTRLAEYYKKDQKIIDASRIVGYYKYKWMTGSWIDKIDGGLRIKVYFTYFMDRKNLELVRIGTSINNFHENIKLSPITEVIDSMKIYEIAPGISAKDIHFKITKQGKIILTFIHKKYDYDIDAVTGVFSRRPHYTLMCDILPYAQHLYHDMEVGVDIRRKRRK
jgi:hypothetical protein